MFIIKLAAAIPCALVRERRRSKNRCRIIDCWCARHVGSKFCLTHDYVWVPGEELACQGMAVAA